jgi:subtilisin family serine protease
MDENGHGTHCAGIIGAEGENNLGIAGVNWKVQIMPLKFMNAGGFGTRRTRSKRSTTSSTGRRRA